MSHIDALAALLGVEVTAPPPLNDGELTYMSGFISGLRANPGGGVPSLPAHAPLVEPSRLWLDGMLAGLFSRVDAGAQRAIMANTPRATLLWASQTGNSEALAERFAKRLDAAGIAVELCNMADYPLAKLSEANNLLVLSSTFGVGDSPDCG